MKNYIGSKIMLGLLVLALISASVNADARLHMFPFFKQGVGTVTCWATCIRMIMMYYGVVKDEDENNLEMDIRRLAFGTPDTEPAPNLPYDLFPTGELLFRLLHHPGRLITWVPISPDDVAYYVGRGLPIIAATKYLNSAGDIDSTSPGHMYVITGYSGSGDNMMLTLAEPDPLVRALYVHARYSEFVTNRPRINEEGVITAERWVGSIALLERPPYIFTTGREMKNIFVSNTSLSTKTINAALSRTESKSSLFERIILWETSVPFEEQLVFDSTIFNTDIMPHFRFSQNPILRSHQALRVLRGARNIRLMALNIDGDEAIHNAGELDLLSLTVTSALGPAIHNAGMLRIYHGYSVRETFPMVTAASGNAIHNTGVGTMTISNTTVTTASGNAIYNTADMGSITITNGTISSASGYAAINNASGGTISLNGTVEVSTASGSDGIAIYNSNRFGRLDLGGNPNIIGRIVGFEGWRVAVHSPSSTRAFNPEEGRVYTLVPRNLRDGDVVIVNGANFFDNFEFIDPTSVFVPRGNDIVAFSTWRRRIISRLFGPSRTIRAASSSAGPGYELLFVDNMTYEEQVTIGSDLPDITIRSSDSSATAQPTIKFFQGGDTPQNHAGFNAHTQGGNSATAVDDIADNSTVRIFDTHGILIDGINIEGENAVYNTGEVAIKNGTISATSYYALYNTGTAELTDVTASTIESDYAIYNTGTLHITDGTISTESAAGGAIYNFGSDGQLILAGSPNITGRITGFGAGRVSVATTYPNSFAPNNRTYLLAPSNLEDGDIVVTNGAGFIANFELVGDDFVLAVNGNDLVAHGEATAVMSVERVIPSNEHPEETSYIFSRNDVTRNEFSAGPVPVDRQSGSVVNFFWQGERIKNSTLTIYDAAGNSVRRLSITDASGRTGSLPPVRRQTGSWDLTDRRGRPVSEGTYLVKGTIRTVDGQRENVSVILGVR